MNLAVKAVTPSRQMRRLRYWLVVTAIGMLTAWLGSGWIPSTAFLLCAMAPFALALRLWWPAALASALLVALPIGDLPTAGLMAFGTLLVSSWRQLRGRHPGMLAVLVLLMVAPVLWISLRTSADLVLAGLSACLLLLGLYVALYGAIQMDALASSAAQRRHATVADQLAASLTVMASAPLCLLLLVAYAGWERFDAAHRQARVEEVGRRIDRAVQLHLQKHLEAIRYTAGETTLPRRFPRLDMLQGVYPGFLTLLITDAHGNIERYHAPGASSFSGEVSDRSYFTEPRRSGRPFVSEVFRGRGFGNDILVAVSAPHVTAEGAFQGVVEGSLSLAFMRQQIAAASQVAGAQFVVQDVAGKVVTSSLPEFAALQPAEGARLQKQEPSGPVLLNRSGSDLIAGREVADLGWSVHALLPLAPLELQRILAKLALAVACLGIIAFFSGATRGFVQRFLGPMREMVTRIRQVDLADASTLVPLDIKVSSADFAELVADFNQMLQRLRELNAELTDAAEQQKQLNLQLESRVDERTTELQEALLRAEHLAAAKSMFLANMSHELRTPLTAILGFAEQALREREPRSSWHDTLRTIARNGRHLLEVVNDVLDAGKIDSGQMQTERVALSPVLLCHEVVRMLRERALQRGLSLELDCRWPLPERLYSDPLRLRQVLINLLGNAIKFTPRGSICVRLVCSDPGELQIQVIDSGVGMSAEQTARLFRPFEQGDIGTTRRFGGSGLGLYITAKLVAALGGRISVESTPEVGSAFSVRLPVDAQTGWLQAMPELPAYDEEVLQMPRLAGRVLVVDDVADLRILVEQMVRATGAATESAANGAEAIDRALRGDVDLVLMDMHMPVMDGRSATQMLRARGFDAPIIALTADVLVEDVERFRAAGCNLVLSKPVDRQQLYDVLGNFLPAARLTVSSDVMSAGSMNNDPAAPAAPSDPASVLPAVTPDRAQALQDALERVRQRFAERAAEEISGLEEELARGDRQALAIRLHKLKGSAGSFGYAAVYACARDAEELLEVPGPAWQAAHAALVAALRAISLPAATAPP